MFRSVDWTHDMIIVKWHLFVSHERKFCALTNAPPVQSTRTGQWLSNLIHANCSAAPLYVLLPFAIHRRPKLQATIILAGITIHWALRRIFSKISVFPIMTNVMVKTCLNRKFIKNSNLIPAMKYSACPKLTFIRRPNLPESRMLRSVDWTHDMIIVKWHLFIWHERKFCAVTNAPPVQSTRTGQWLSTLLNANCSAAQVYVLHPSQFIYPVSCRQRSFFHG